MGLQQHGIPVSRDLILDLGSNDPRVAERADQLFLAGYAPLLAFSGGLGRLTQELYPKPEAEVFAEVAIRLGVPREHILLENQSTNTGENILFTRRLLDQKGLHPKKILLVQKPYMLRRAYATAKKQWPEVDFLVTGPQISFTEYPTDKIPKDLLINILGETRRDREYPRLGFQIPQEMPGGVGCLQRADSVRVHTAFNLRIGPIFYVRRRYSASPGIRDRFMSNNEKRAALPLLAITLGDPAGNGPKSF